ncbi:hypothetical protein LCGC14_2985100 [marine sediment metagenome]|uniref:Uncharacterized protein n=1 Tax=marine sediment metagenome TaxID=412755 RepID=A0A0F8ZWR4_9ZZZZ
MKDEKLPKNMIVAPIGVKRRTGTKFIKEVEKPYVILKPFFDGLLEIGQTYVKYISKEELNNE